MSDAPMQVTRLPTLAEPRPAPRAAASGPALALRWGVFRVLEWASGLRNRRQSMAAPVRSNPPPPFGSGKESIWIFVSTIGELNAIEPFLRPFVAEMQPSPVTLLTDRLIYRESYRTKYPDAYVYEMDGTSGDIERLIALTPPRLLLIAEIPCLLSDAPCRFPFAAVYGARRAGASVALINGWLYGYVPPSRLDAIERRLLGRDYLCLMDLITVQNDGVRQRLIAEGADPTRVHVTGNTKFDGVVRQQWNPQGKRSEAILRSIIDGERPCVVAGCVTDYEDQVMILDAFAVVIKRISEALLVLAPRHPENREMMAKLEALLTERGWRHKFRSRIGDARLPPEIQIMILDTMGELKDFYAASTVCYVGRDHNILEPLTFGKPVTISPGWEATFPSYPVYAMLRDAESVHEFASPDGHASGWLPVLAQRGIAGTYATAADTALSHLRGASEANLRLLRQIIPGARRHG